MKAHLRVAEFVILQNGQRRASAKSHADLHHPRRRLQFLRGDRSVGIVESNGVVFKMVEKARHRPPESTYNVGKFWDLEILLSGTKHDTTSCTVSGCSFVLGSGDKRLTRRTDESTGLVGHVAKLDKKHIICLIKPKQRQQRHRIHIYLCRTQ